MKHRAFPNRSSLWTFLCFGTLAGLTFLIGAAAPSADLTNENRNQDGSKLNLSHFLMNNEWEPENWADWLPSNGTNSIGITTWILIKWKILPQLPPFLSFILYSPGHQTPTHKRKRNEKKCWCSSQRDRSIRTRLDFHCRPCRRNIN